MLFLVLPVLRPSACSPGREHPFGPRNEFASIVRFPNRHMPPSPRRGGDRLKICGDHSQGETPGPIPNPEAKALHGDGTAPERVWESSTSPLTLLDRIPVEPLRGFPGSFSYIRGIPVPGFLSFSSGGPGFPFPSFFSGPGCARRAWSVSVAAVNDVMRFTRYACAGSRESRYDGKRQKPDN